MGSATVSATFPLTSSKSSAVRAVGGGAKIAGVRVTAGTLRREASCYRVMRNQEVVWQVGDEEPRGDVAGGCARPCVTRCLPACLPACLGCLPATATACLLGYRCMMTTTRVPWTRMSLCTLCRWQVREGQ